MTDTPPQWQQDAAASAPSLQDLLSRCNTLTTELEEFKQHLARQKRSTEIEIAHFRNAVKSERRTLERLAAKAAAETSITGVKEEEEDVEKEDENDGSGDENSSSTDAAIAAAANAHTISSSNLPFLETVWNTVKHTRGLQALQKRYYWHSIGRVNPKANGDYKRSRNNVGANKLKQSALVDVVAQEGLEWVKVSLISNTRLLFDKAKQGWEDESSDSDSDSDCASDGNKKCQNSDDEDDDSDVPLVRMTKDLLRAAAHVRIRTRTPHIRLVLPKIQENKIREIDAIIASLRHLGVKVETSSSIPPTVTLADVLPTLLTDSFANITPTVNIDCTILLALVSDFSHTHVASEPWFHRALNRQLEIEAEDNLLPSLLYPAVTGRVMTCTRAAAWRMREIVDTIGTPGEKARTALLMGADDQQAGWDTDDAESRLRCAWQEQSVFPVPATLRLPVHVVSDDFSDVDFSPSSTPPSPSATTAETPSSLLPAPARSLAKVLTPINRSVFFYGWARGLTTVTSNRTVVKQIEHVLAAEARDENEWPNVWLCPTARSLVGKEKGRKE